MGKLVCIALFVAAGPAVALEPVDARHLLGRTGFGPSRAEIEALARLNREQAVDKVLDGVRAAPVTPAPTFDDLGELLATRPKKDAPPEMRRAFRMERRDEAIDLKAWWAREMLVTPSPFTEHMVLFWHNHFTSSVDKVKVPQLLWEQHALLRKEATGNFARLLHAIVDDRAMLVYLDGARNQAKAPNENFARELIELFTLGTPTGEGYSERDVKEAARALTGTTVSRRTGAVAQRRSRHDRGEKEFLGVKGELDSDDVVRILLKHPRTAENIVEKLWREFISPDPDAREVTRLARVLVDNNWEMKPLLRAMFLSDAFWDAKNRGVLIKSPVDLVIGSARALELVNDGGKNPSGEWCAFTMKELGQDLFDPPNVKGWPGGERWITTLTLPHRERLARDAVAAARVQPDVALLLPLPSTTAHTLDDIARDPAFQLK